VLQSGSAARAQQAEFRRAAARAVRPEQGLEKVLAYVPLFSQCSKRELRLVAKLATTRKVRAGTALLSEGEPGESMYVLLSGTALVLKGGRVLRELGTGDVVGELAVLSRAPRNATVQMTHDGEVAMIRRRDVYRLIDDAAGVARKLLEALADRVRDLAESAIDC
jgi:CRP-like cAMP-binding protein